MTGENIEMRMKILIIKADSYSLTAKTACQIYALNSFAIHTGSQRAALKNWHYDKRFTAKCFKCRNFLFSVNRIWGRSHTNSVER